MEKQDEADNKEIALERTVEDTKKQILEADITGGKFSADEDTMLYFFLLSSLRKEHFAAVGIAEDKQYITDEDKMGIIGNLTVRMKTIIRRDFLVANFKGAYGNNTVATLLLDFARRHMPEELANIEREYNGVYEKRHQRIEGKESRPLGAGTGKGAQGNATRGTTATRRDCSLKDKGQGGEIRPLLSFVSRSEKER